MEHTTVSIADPILAAAAEKRVGPVLVALKPFDGNHSAVAMARWLAERGHVELHALSVVEMGDVGTAVAGVPPLPEEYYQHERDEVASDLRARVSNVAAGDMPFRVDVMEGPPSSTVAHLGRDRGASVVVVGTGRHGILGRFLYGERALEVVRNAVGPVLVVPPKQAPPIQRAIVAVDFSQASLRAASSALELLSAGSRLTLVHVETGMRLADDHAGKHEEEYERRTRTMFARFAAALPASPGVTVDTTVLRGDAPAALLRFAKEHGVQLIACGRRRHSLVERLLVGSVSTALVRAAPCSVLVAPAESGDSQLDEGVGPFAAST